MRKRPALWAMLGGLAVAGVIVISATAGSAGTQTPNIPQTPQLNYSCVPLTDVDPNLSDDHNSCQWEQVSAR